MSGLSPEEVVEIKHSLAGFADLTRAFYLELVSQDFATTQALALTQTWLSSMIRLSGQSSGDEA